MFKPTPTVVLARTGAAQATKMVVPHWAGAAWGVPAATGVLAVMSQWDHEHEMHTYLREYKEPVARITGKPVHEVKLKDLEAVGKVNPTIGEAIKRSRSQRNLSVGVTLIGGVAALAIAAVAVAPVAGVLLAAVGASAASTVIGGVTAGTVAHLAATALVSFASFLGVEHTLDKIGENKLGLKEPSIKDVEHNPRKQGELFVSSQVTYLRQLQSRGQKISGAQVMTVFASANKALGEQIKTRYGVEFHKLGKEPQADALKRFGPQYNVEKIADDLNNRRIWARELAFTAYGQSSGEPRFTRKSDELQKRVDELTAQLNQQTGRGESPVAFRSGNVQGTVLGQQQMTQQEEASDTRRSDWAQQMNARRQTAQAAFVG